MNIFGKDLILYPQEPSYKIRSKNFRNYNLDDIDKFYLPESIIQIEGYKNIQQFPLLRMITEEP